MIEKFENYFEKEPVGMYKRHRKVFQETMTKQFEILT